MKRLLPILILIISLFTSANIFAQDKFQKETLEGKPVKINKEQFLKYIYNYEANPAEWNYEGNLPCIIDFYADWCGPCRRLAPILSNIAQKYKGRVIVYKVDTESQKELASYFEIRSLPTIIFVPVKGTPNAAMGLMPETEIEKVISDLFQIKQGDTKEI